MHCFLDPAEAPSPSYVASLLFVRPVPGSHCGVVNQGIILARSLVKLGGNYRPYYCPCTITYRTTTKMASTPRLLLQQLLSADFLFRVTITSLLVCWRVSAWGSDEDTAVYGNSLSRDWLYNSKVISMELEGCMWGYVEDNEESGCMEDGSEDGTTYWYQMANCRRAQAVFSLYATDSGSSASCSNGTFKESVSRCYYWCLLPLGHSASLSSSSVDEHTADLLFLS